MVKSKFSTSQIKEMIRLYACERKSIEKIAEIFTGMSCTPMGVKNILKRNGVHIRERGRKTPPIR